MPQRDSLNDGDFGQIIIGSTTISATSHNETFEIIAGDNITLTPNATAKTITMAAVSGGVAPYDTTDLKSALRMGAIVTLTPRASPSCENQFQAAASMGGLIETTPIPESFDINTLQLTYAMDYMQ